VPLFYGRVWLDDELQSIKGMSGGPIFAFQKDGNGLQRYWLIALQSRWLNQSHYIAACQVAALGEAIQLARAHTIAEL